jgi:hypothetical protein
MNHSLVQARAVILDAVVCELIEEQNDMATDLSIRPKLEEVTDTAYDVLVANKDRHPLTHILDFTEEEVTWACKHNWSTT